MGLAAKKTPKVIFYEKLLDGAVTAFAFSASAYVRLRDLKRRWTARRTR
jgi:hypothetical protein